MSQRISRPNPQPPRPPPAPDEDQGLPRRLRQARILALKAQIRRGQYDVDSKIGGLIDEVVRGEV